jgi:hypothetical protein
VSKFISQNFSNSFSDSTSETYLVLSPSCNIPSLDLFAPDVMELFMKKDFPECAKSHALTSIEQNFEKDIVKVVYHDEFEQYYLNKSNSESLKCYFQEITRQPKSDFSYV